MIRTLTFISASKEISSFQRRDAFWVSFGRFIIKHLSSHSSDEYESVYTDSESYTDTMDDLDDIFDEVEGDFDIQTIYEAGYDADSEDDC